MLIICSVGPTASIHLHTWYKRTVRRSYMEGSSSFFLGSFLVSVDFAYATRAHRDTPSRNIKDVLVIYQDGPSLHAWHVQI